MKVYALKKLITGHLINAQFSGLTLVALKEGKAESEAVKIEHKGSFMFIDKNTPVLSKSPWFDDKYGREQYRLNYYLWQPTIQEQMEL